MAVSLSSAQMLLTVPVRSPTKFALSLRTTTTLPRANSRLSNWNGLSATRTQVPRSMRRPAAATVASSAPSMTKATLVSEFVMAAPAGTRIETSLGCASAGNPAGISNVWRSKSIGKLQPVVS